MEHDKKMNCICHYPTMLCSRCSHCTPNYEYHWFGSHDEKCMCHGFALEEIEEIKKRKFHPCQIEKKCEWYYGYDGKRKHMKYHEKKCNIQTHQWIEKEVEKEYISNFRGYIRVLVSEDQGKESAQKYGDELWRFIQSSLSKVAKEARKQIPCCGHPCCCRVVEKSTSEGKNEED